MKKKLVCDCCGKEIEKFTEWMNDFQVTDYINKSEQIMTAIGEKEWLENTARKKGGCVILLAGQRKPFRNDARTAADNSHKIRTKRSAPVPVVSGNVLPCEAGFPRVSGSCAATGRISA